MSNQLTNEQANWALAMLDVSQKDFSRVQHAQNLKSAQEALSQLKEKASKNYKQRAFELHPDRTGNDPEKTKQFVILGAMKEHIESMRVEVQRPRPIPMPIMVSFYHNPFMDFGTSTSTTTTTSSSAFGSVWMTW